MNNLLRPLFYYLWIFPHILQIVILAVVTKRRLYRNFPIFGLYSLFSLGDFAILIGVGRAASSQSAYFQWYWVALILNTALRFAVINELFSHLFASHHSASTWRRPFFRWNLVAFLVVASLFAAYTRPSGADPIWFNVHVLERSANIVLCGLILALLMCSRFLSLAWSRIDFGIALGFGVLCSFELALAAVRSQFGLSAHLALDLVDMAIYHVCVLIWLIFLLLPEKRSTSVLGTSHVELEAWRSELQQLSPR